MEYICLFKIRNSMKYKHLLLTSILLFAIKFSYSQTDTFTCAFDTLLQWQADSNQELHKVKKNIDYGAKRFRERNVNLPNYSKPQTAPPCSTCLTIEDNCFETKYLLPVIVHVVHLPSDNTIGLGSNISKGHIDSAMVILNRKFAGYNQNDQRAVNTGI